MKDIDLQSFLSFKPFESLDYLDLEQHSPAQYEGKWVRCNGREYRIAEIVGEGHEKIVHRLMNGISEGCLHVIQIPHDQESASSRYKAQINLLSVTNSIYATKMLADDIVFETDNGTFIVEEALFTNYESRSQGTYESLRDAQARYKSGDVSGAIDCYIDILTKSPHHTFALNNLAALLAERDDFEAATNVQRITVFIEPNYRPYRLALVRYATRTSHLSLIYDQILQLHRIFPYSHDVDAVELDLLLTIGNPERALVLLESAQLKEEERPVYKIAIDDALGKKKTAWALIKPVEAALAQGIGPALLPVVERAHSIYDRDPWIAANTAFTKRAAGALERVKELLLFASEALPSRFRPVCLANAAFAEIERGQFASAIRLLRESHDDLLSSQEGQLTDLSLVPGVAEWINAEWVLELGAESAIPLMQRLISSEESRSHPLGDLLALYQRVAEWQSSARNETT
jgi:hypothetical protein